MGRWEPDALPRLQQAAMELFLSQGYEATTVAQIADRAGLTQRTFFRYFADKKEVLFAGTQVFEDRVVEAVAASKAGEPLDRVVGAFLALAPDYFENRAEAVRYRRSIIESSAELQEREGQKMVRVADRVTALLAQDGVPAARARLTADLGVLVFRSAFAEWACGGEGTLAETVRRKLGELRILAGGGSNP